MPPRRALRWSAVAILANGLLPVGPVCVLAQSSQAVCQAPFSWMANSKGQSPCVVTAYLGGACYNGQFTVPALASDFVYYGPYADVPQQLECECNNVFYNVISACGLCQNHSIISWSEWNYNCSSTGVVGSFPPGIPLGTAIPQWAFQDVLASNMFNVTIAQSVGDSPESTGTHVPSTTVISSTTSAKASLTSSPSITSSSPTPSSSAPSTAVIAGGVVGGVVGVAVVVALVAAIVSIMRKKREYPPSVRYSTAPGSPPPTSYTGNVFAPQMVQPKLYDPSDPSTFPSTPISPTYSNLSIRPGTYTGMPEVQR